MATEVKLRSFTFRGKQYTLNPVDPVLFIRAKSSEWKKLFAQMITPKDGIDQEFLNALWAESRNVHSSFYRAFAKLHRDLLTPAQFRK